MKLLSPLQGHTQGSEKLALAVWNHESEKWEKVDSGSGSDGSDFSLNAKIDAADYVSEGEVRAMIAPDLVSNGSDTIGWLTDTQYYTESRFTFGGMYKIMTQWLTNQYKQNNIGYVAHTGDLTESVDDKGQWKIADEAQSILDDANVPNGVVAGNHDVGDSPDSKYESTGYFAYFGEDRYKHQPWYGGSYKNNTHHYDLVTIGGKDLIMLYLGMGVEITPESVAWANSVLEAYSNRNAILLVHQYLGTNGDFDEEHHGEQIFEKIIKPNENVALVLSGHNPGVAKNTRKVDSTRYVQEILSDYQEYDDLGGDGFLRTLQFSDDKLINRTYSPVTGERHAYSVKEDNFTLDLPLQDSNRKIATGSFSVEVR